MRKFVFVSLNFINLFFGSLCLNNEDKEYWMRHGINDIKYAQIPKINNKTAKNVIIFVGDGMGLTTSTAARIYAKGEKDYLSFEKFPHIGVIKTYSANKLVPDSCSTATALFCGVKANHKTSGVDQTVNFNDCEASLKPSAQLDSIINWAQKANKSTGFVTTTRVTHATPSALYAHTPDRNWECEAKIPSESRQCKDIARQLIEDEPGRSINVIMGGGRQCLESGAEGTDHDPIDTWACRSKDGRNLIKDWIADKKNRSLSHSFIKNTEQLMNVDPKTDYVLGIFANGHLNFDYARDRSNVGMPSLENMTKKAIEILSNNPNGYILMVEGGLIDYGHHRGYARKALDETARFSEAIELATNMVNEEDTLIIVTSDHAHSMVFTGYPSREQNVLDIAENSLIDNIPFTSLIYGTGGPNNYQYEIKDNKVSRLDPSENNTRDFEYSQQAAVVTDEVHHSGSDVLVYAKGPMSHLFESVHEQTYVAYVISYAANIGPLAHNATTPIKNQIFVTFLSFLILLFLKYYRI